MAVSIFRSRRSASRSANPLLYQYNLFIPWEIDCRIEARGLVPAAQPVTCEAAKGDPPDEDLAADRPESTRLRRRERRLRCQSRRRERRKSLFRRPPTSMLAAIGTRKPAVCFCRSEQASIAFAAVDILAELARTICRYRTGHQRQARCFTQQIGPSRSVHRRRTAHHARRDRDRAEIASGIHPLRSRDWRECLRGVLARDLFKQPF